MEAYELACAMKLERLQEERGQEFAREFPGCTRSFGSLEELVGFLEGGGEVGRKKRWWEFWKKGDDHV
jgi:hypothetical protein